MKNYVLISVFVVVIASILLFNWIGATPPVSQPIIQENAKVENPETPINRDIQTMDVSIKEQFYDIPLSKETQKLIYDECIKYDVSFELMLAIAKVESNFDNSAVSRTNDVGMFQLNRAVVQQVSRGTGIENFSRSNLEHNIKGAVYEVSRIKNALTNQGYSEEEIYGLQILCYNRGLGGGIKYFKDNPNVIHNDKYLIKVVTYKDYLEQQK